MIETPKISIIVPVYNAEKSLCRCLDSIVSQTFQDWECILVDDGSTDSSSDICDNFGMKDCRFKVIHKQNGGVASARQIGNDLALGEFSIHADADDWLESRMLDDLIFQQSINNADVVVCDYYSHAMDNSYIVKCQKLSNDTIIGMFDDIIHNRIIGSLWNKLIRHKLYEQYNVRFIENVNYCEDVLLFAQFINYHLKVDYLDKAYYHYIYTPTSITKTDSIEKYAMKKRFFIELNKLPVISSLQSRKDYLVRYMAHCFKMELILKQIITRQEFYDFFPPCDDVVYSIDRVSNKIVGFLFLHKMFYIGSFFYKVFCKIDNIKGSLKIIF